MTHPLLTPEMELAIETAPASFLDRFNVYVCRSCRGHIVTRDVDKGVTPFTTSCKVTDGCPGLMQSSMYRVAQFGPETHQWFRPANAAGLTQNTLDHVARGGLLLREAVS